MSSIVHFPIQERRARKRDYIFDRYAGQSADFYFFKLIYPCRIIRVPRKESAGVNF